MPPKCPLVSPAKQLKHQSQFAKEHHIIYRCFESTVKEGSSMAFATPTLTLSLNKGIFPTNPVKNRIQTGFLLRVLLPILSRPPGLLSEMYVLWSVNHTISNKPISNPHLLSLLFQLLLIL